MARVDVRSWRAAYRGLLPDSFLDGLAPEANAAVWRTEIAAHGARGRKRWFIAEEAGHVVAYALAGRPSHSEEGMLYLLYALPEVWGTGVGKSLLHACIDAMRDLRLPSAVLWVLAANERARRFYEKHGWAPTGRSSFSDYGGVAFEAVEYRIDLADRDPNSTRQSPSAAAPGTPGTAQAR